MTVPCCKELSTIWKREAIEWIYFMADVKECFYNSLSLCFSSMPLQFKELSFVSKAWGFLFKLLLNFLLWELIPLWLAYNVICKIQEHITSSSSSSTEMVGHSSTGKAASTRKTKCYQNSNSAWSLFYRSYTLHFLFNFNTALKSCMYRTFLTWQG